MTIAAAAIRLFFVMDPVGNIPLFLAALKPVEPARRMIVVARELLIAYALLAGFLFAGGPLLGSLGISEPALSIAGGIVLFLIAVRMVFPEVHGPLAEPVNVCMTVLLGQPTIEPMIRPVLFIHSFICVPRQRPSRNVSTPRPRRSY